MFDQLPPEKYLQDLHWALLSEDLVQATDQPGLSNFQIDSKLKLWLFEENHKEALEAHVRERNPRRLGHYFECLWEYVFIHYPDYELQAKNLQVNGNKGTLGEFDFIVKDKNSNQSIHLELAVKFYLGIEQNSSQVTWMGPGCIDRLDIKLTRLFEHQTRLSQIKAAQAVLENKSIHQVKPQLVVKGALFQPYGTNLPLPNTVNRASPPGFWLPLSKTHTLENDPGEWRILDKAHWLSTELAANADQPDQTVDFTGIKEAVLNRLSRYNYPVMLAFYGAGDQEQKRFFITPDDWPETS